jgi:hypothetical protein
VAPVPRSSGVTETGRPPTWWPRAGWGTVRGLRAGRRGNGRADLSFYFVPDDSSAPQLIQLADTVAPQELGEYARGIMRDGHFTVKVSAASMAETERLFQTINQMGPPERKHMFASLNGLDGDAGWACMPNYTLVKVAPGLAT